MRFNYRHLLILGWIASLGHWVYPLIALAIFFEGEAVIYTVMFLSFQGMLAFKLTIPITIASVLATDFISYKIGVHGPKYFPRIAHMYAKISSPLDERLHTLSFAAYLISKFTYGMHRAVLIRSGMIGIPFKKLFKINIVTSAIWIAAITAVAYASWQSISYIGKSLRYVEVVLLVGVIGVLVGSHLISHLTKMKLLK